MSAAEHLGSQWSHAIDFMQALPGEHVSEGLIPTKSLKPSHDITKSIIWNPEEQNRLRAHIKENGIQTPLSVSFGSRGPTEKPRYILNDGNHRLFEARRLKMSKVPVRVYHRTDPSGAELPGFEERS